MPYSSMPCHLDCHWSGWTCMNCGCPAPKTILELTGLGLLTTVSQLVLSVWHNPWWSPMAWGAAAAVNYLQSRTLARLSHRAALKLPLKNLAISAMFYVGMSALYGPLLEDGWIKHPLQVILLGSAVGLAIEPWPIYLWRIGRDYFSH